MSLVSDPHNPVVLREPLTRIDEFYPATADTDMLLKFRGKIMNLGIKLAR